ncbi:type 1 phosphatases regulator YPI1 [Hordeum vulgare]|nr:type 1 phosphatases regulator YPI1 [Hordeum vulgare]
MSGSKDSQNDFREPSVEMDPCTSCDNTNSDPGSYISHGLPKAVTRQTKKLNSDEEDLDFVSEETSAPPKAPKKTVGKEYGRPADLRAPESARNKPPPVPQLKTQAEQMAFLVSSIQGMEKNIQEIVQSQKSLERVVETKYHDMDMKLLHHSGDSDSAFLAKVAATKKVSLKEGTFNNEFLVRKSSKKCCIFHKEMPYKEDCSDNEAEGGHRNLPGDGS